MRRMIRTTLFLSLILLAGTGSGVGATTPVSGTISSDTTWTVANSPYYVQSTVTVNSGVTLTIEGGVVVKFAGGHELKVNGTLNANGRSGGRIYFTDYRDDSVGGDTNGDGNATSPAAGWWRGIAINDGGSAALNYSIIRYGGSSMLRNIQKYGGGSLTLTNCIVSNSSGYGVVKSSGTSSLTITGSTISDNDLDGIYLNLSTGTINLNDNNISNNTRYGIYDSNSDANIFRNTITANGVGVYCTGSNPVIGGSPGNGNNIFRNTTYGVQNVTTSNVNACYNWWGSAGGPYHATLNPSGAGNPVSNNVDFGNFLANPQGNVNTKGRGKIVLVNDDWVLSDAGFAPPNDPGTFATNIAAWFTGGRPGKFHAYSNQFGLTGLSLETAMTDAGHTWTTGTDGFTFNLSTLQQYDGIFLLEDPADTSVLIEYVESGGNVYLAYTGDPSDDQYNAFVNYFGLGLALINNGIKGNFPISSSHPIFEGVDSLYNDNGSDILDLAPADRRQVVLVSQNGHGLYAAYDGGIFTQSDFDGDRKADIAVWRPGEGMWYILRSSDGGVTAAQWGSGALHDVLVPGDYDKDGKIDCGIWRPGDGMWYILRSSDGGVTAIQWGSGALNDVPVPGDYDGDGKTDYAVWRKGDGNWYILRSSDGGVTVTQWGTGTLFTKSDIPVPGDYDGDGKTDIAVWRPGDGMWYILRSSDGSVTATQWGTGTQFAKSDVPVPGDYDGDGKTDLAVWRPGNGMWFILRSSDGGVTSREWGTGTLFEKSDIPVPGDYDRDGKTDIAVWRPGEGMWYILRSSDGGVTASQWGSGELNDIPLVGNPIIYRFLEGSLY